MKDAHLRTDLLSGTPMPAPAVANGQAFSPSEQPDETSAENRNAGPWRTGKLRAFLMAGAMGLACSLVGTSTAKAQDSTYWNGYWNGYNNAFYPYYYNNHYNDYGDSFYAPYAYSNAYSYPFSPSLGVGMIYGGGGYPYYDRLWHDRPGSYRDHRYVYGRQAGRFQYGWY